MHRAQRVFLCLFYGVTVWVAKNFITDSRKVAKIFSKPFFYKEFQLWISLCSIVETHDNVHVVDYGYITWSHQVAVTITSAFFRLLCL